jgi:F-box and leucine-rich repeat protein GRR1
MQGDRRLWDHDDCQEVWHAQEGASSSWQPFPKVSSFLQIKLRQLQQLTDLAIIALARSCPYLLEIDLFSCPLISDPSLWAIWRNLTHVRELTINGASITNAGIPVRDKETGEVLVGGGDHLEEVYSNTRKASESTIMRSLVTLPTSRLVQPDFWTPVSPKRFEHIRVLDLTAQTPLTDRSIDNIVSCMPRIRTLILAKCSLLTDESVTSICRLGKHLHYLHLGHVQSCVGAVFVPSH